MDDTDELARAAAPIDLALGSGDPQARPSWARRFPTPARGGALRERAMGGAACLLMCLGSFAFGWSVRGDSPGASPGAEARLASLEAALAVREERVAEREAVLDDHWRIPKASVSWLSPESIAGLFTGAARTAEDRLNTEESVSEATRPGGR